MTSSQPLRKPRTKYVPALGKRFAVVLDSEGVLRFPCNRIIRDLLDCASTRRKLDLNEIAHRVGVGVYTVRELRELYMQIGYSVGGIEELSFFIPKGGRR